MTEGAHVPPSTEHLLVRTARSASTETQVLWHERIVTVLAGGQLRIVVPLVGGTLTAASSSQLTRVLEHRWVTGVLPTATSVLAAIAVDGETRTLTLLIAAIRAPGDGARVDDLRLARQLRSAIRMIEHDGQPA
jgi:hypothetical protein